MAISTSIPIGSRSRVSGITLNKGTFDTQTSNLPQVICIFAEANTANQSGLTTDKKQVTSAKEVGNEYGFGSPIHNITRILFPVSGSGVGGIPVIVFPQIEAGGATVSTVEFTVTGTATSNATHSLIVNGRSSLDFQTYSYSVVSGDTPTIIAGKMKDAINSVLNSPVSAANTLGVMTSTTKWKGETSKEINITIDTGTNTAGVTYVKTAQVDGSGTVSLTDSFTEFGSEDWNTIIINSYGTVKLSDFEVFNGKPDDLNPTGRYVGEIFKPFVALFGSTLDDKDDLIAITDAAARKEENTNVLCPAPRSNGFTWEAAANMCAAYARIAQDTPHLDVNNQSYPDMPIPLNGTIGDMAEYTNRDLLVKAGCSNVVLKNGKYTVQDFVTTYHPDGEIPLQFAYVRNLTVDFNYAFGHRALDDKFVKDHVLLENGQQSDATKTITTKEWKAILFDYFDELGLRSLIKDIEFSKENLVVEIDGINPDRINTLVRYKRTPIGRITSATVEAGF